MNRCLFLFILLILPDQINAQLLNCNNVSITINPATELTVLGDVVTSGSTDINNTGEITLTGDWINNSGNNCFGTSQGIVNFSGNNQNIGGSSTTLFNNLNLSGTGIKTLNQNIITGGGNASPTGVLNLNDRTLELNSKTLTINNPSPAALTRTTGFIESETDPIIGYGTINWLTGNITNGEVYTFPFGNNGSGDFIPVIASFTSSVVSPSGSLSVATYPTNTLATPNNRPLPTGLTVLTSFAGTENAQNTLDRFWIIDLNNYPLAPTSNLTLSYRESEWSTGSNSIIENTLAAQHHDFVSWSTPPTGTINTVSNNIVISGVNSYNHIWALAGSTSPLPVELIYFTAEAENNLIVNCKWITSSEINNDYFTVERSRDGLHFAPVGTVKGAGNSFSVLEYLFIDNTPYKGTSYYRLKQTDFDGNFSYSQIVAVKIYDSKNHISIYPNPASDVLNIQLNGITSGSIEILDAAGRLVFLDSFQQKDQHQININFLSKAVYTVKITGSEDSVIQKLIVN